MTRDQTQNEAGPEDNRKSNYDLIRLVTLGGVFVLMVISLLIVRLIDQASTGLNHRLTKIEKQLENVSGRTDNAAAKTPPRRGPDPNRVYSINTAGAPSKGSPIAEVTIAEFSDFQ